MRVIVTGGRYYDDVLTLSHVLDVLRRNVTLVHGDCPTGADALADAYWLTWGVKCPERHPADWKRWGKRAGFVRNEEMAAAGAGLCIAFPGNDGTNDMIRRAKAHMIPVMRVDA